MKFRNFPIFFLMLISLGSLANAQKTEVTISFNEQFFDALLDAIFRHAGPPEFPLARNHINRRDAKIEFGVRSSELVPMHSFTLETRNSKLETQFRRPGDENPVCKETIQLSREANGVRTAVRFRDGKIYAPLAFTGSYNPPFIGCVPFSGIAEANIELEFDQNNQRLTARANVMNVSLTGTGGVGGNVIARLIQSSIDKKVNPIEIIRLDKLSFAVPIQNSGGLKMKAVGMRHEIRNGVLSVHVAFEFLKA
jgi:hypothetical protein